jgi:hypothetical protein
MASNTCITNKLNSLSNKYNDLYRVVACNSKKINECCPNNNHGVEGPTGPRGATGVPGTFDPNNLQLKCGLTGTITPNNAVCVELEKTTPSVNNSLPNAPSEGFRRDHIIAEDPCKPIPTNFFLTVNHSQEGHGSVIGYNNNLPNNGTVRGSVISGGESNLVTTLSEFATIGGGFNSEIKESYSTICGGANNSVVNKYSNIAGGRENGISGKASSILGGEKNIIKSSDFCTISSGFSNGIVLSNNSNINGGDINYIQNGCTGSTVSGGKNNGIDSNVNNSNISGGISNEIKNVVNNSNISGGRQNVILKSDNSNISGGQSNVLNEVKYSGVLSGSSNSILNSETSSIGSGTKHLIQNNVTSSNINSGVNNTLTDNVSLSFIGGGTQNTIRENVTSCIISGGNNNKIVEDVDYSGIFSGRDNKIINNINDSSILSGLQNEIKCGPSGTNINTSVISGGSKNIISLDTAGKPQGLVISGGGDNKIENYTLFDNINGGKENVIDTAFYCNIGGGYKNQIEIKSEYSNINGGRQNKLSEVSNSNISGGYLNVINNTDNSNIGGGQSNIILDTEHSVIGGGYRNNITFGPGGEVASTIAGGRENFSVRLCPTGPTGPVPRYTKIPGGYQASSFSHGQHVHSSGRIYKNDAWNGKTLPQPDTQIPNSISQTSEYIMKTYIPKAGQTGTQATFPLPVFSAAVLDDGTNLNNSYIYVPPNSAWGFEAIVSIQSRKNDSKFESLPEYSGMLKYCGTVFRDDKNMIVVRSTDPSCVIYSNSNSSITETKLEFLSSGDTGPSVTLGPVGGSAIGTQPSSYCSGGLGVVVVNNNYNYDKYVSILIKTVEISRPPVPYFGSS